MKTTILILCIAILSACSTAVKTDKNVDAAKAMFEAFNKHNWEAMAGFYSETASFLDPSYGQDYVVKTRKETAEKYAAMEQLFPNIRDEIVGIYPSGDKVTVEFVSTGAMSNGVTFSLPIISVLTFQDGLIVKDATYYNLENP